MAMDRLTRRAFIGNSLGAVAATALPPFFIHAAGTSPNEVLRMAVAGVKGRGRDHIAEWLKAKDVQVYGLCDIDETILDTVVKDVEQKGGKAPRFEKDWRKLMEDKSIDAVSIATTNHTHTLLSIWALQAGKHVYVEKPCSHNIWEGRRLVEAARKYKKCVQHGTQKRSSGGNYSLAAFLQAGKIGKIQVSRGLCYKRRASIGKKGEESVPKGVDYDLWLGPAPVRPFTRNRFHYNWHWHWDYGNGDIGNQGVHEMDVARWMIGKGLPKRVMSVGGRFGYEDDGETPNTQIACYDYGDGQQVIFEVRGLETPKYMGENIGNLVHCEKGHVSNNKVMDADGKVVGVDTKASPPGPGGHFQNFINAVRANDPKLLNAEILEGHFSAALCHLGNIPYRLGEMVPFDSKEPAFPGNDAGNETFDRMKAHLKENEVNLTGLKYCRGPVLTFDPEKETFLGNEAANKLLRRDYRPPFVVPENP
jgi:predicted dehydrogenase